ncbi:MAG TPA: M23 family metallopeptidase [Anaerolineae bacterium]|nr:M23 family metallopeptidase [Anaerolineae bacterium]
MQNCFPYPLVNLSLTPQPLVRGKTALLSLETAEPASCEATYLGQTEPCYTDDGTHLYVLLGVSALSDAGDYEIVVRLITDGLETFLRVPLKVAAGRYGYQVINPPAALNKLMDAALMQGEIDYLANWRVIRTPERQWQFPLDFPLPQKVSVSADYGDRRSYGGLVNGYHSGVDYRAWTGLSVVAPAGGVVLLTEKLEARGNAILIDHGWGLVTGYWHLSQSNVKVGQHVQRGDVIGKVGNTGLSTGSHLHWEVWVNGVSVDGKQWLAADTWAQADLTALSVLPVAVPFEVAEPQ